MKAFNKDDHNHVIFAGWLAHMIENEGLSVQEAYQRVDDIKDDLFVGLLEYVKQGGDKQ